MLKEEHKTKKSRKEKKIEMEMALRMRLSNFKTVSFLVLMLVCMSEAQVQPMVFDVRKYGAVAGGIVDNSQAFLKAWGAACEWKGMSEVLIPAERYKTEAVIFKGPCKGKINFVIRGFLVAPNHKASLSNEHWIAFQYIDGLTVSGGGTLDGQGQSAWGFNDCTKNSKCDLPPYSLGFAFVTNSYVNQITSINSKNVHFNLFECKNLEIKNVKLVAPDESPNTDGIRIGASSFITITQSDIETGDDCVAIISGSQNITVIGVRCGPGHGISVGSLGKYKAGETVKGLYVKNCTLTGTENGVRIKTWANSFTGVASDFWFEDIVMNNVYNPIIIDQQYCPNSGCNDQVSSKVQISNVTFKNIRGTSLTKEAVNLECSKSHPCQNIILQDVNLVNVGKGGPATSVCSFVKGRTLGQHQPASCI